VFSWQGDLWLVAATGGEARRLTVHPAAERHPVWSRDGRFLAFSSDRHGSDDVFVMPIDGSTPPRRLTFASVDDTPLDFTPDGSAVLFESNRSLGIRWLPQLWTVPVTGGTPQLHQDAFGQWAAISPDGHATVYVRGATKWTRRGYRGAANRDLWLHIADGDNVQLTDFEGDDDVPSFVDSHTVAFLSSRSGRKNVFLLNLVDQTAHQLSYHDGSDVRFPRAAADGSLVAYEFEDGIWAVDPNGGSPRRLDISVPADQIRNQIERHSDSREASDLVMSPDGKLAAFVVHGNVFVTEVWSEDDQKIAKPPTVQITSTPEREMDPTWSPDGTKLLFASERDGNYDLFTVEPEDPSSGWTGGFDWLWTTVVATPAEETGPAYSPDGTSIAYVRGNGDLMVVATDGGSPREILTHFLPPDFQWSPDGRWLAYSIEDMEANSDIWIVSVDGGEPYNVSRHPDFDESPSWSPDGRRLLWTSRRHGQDFDIWGVWLTHADDQRTPEQWLQVWKASDDAAKKAKKSDDGEDDEQDAAADDAPTELPVVTIDFDRLWDRAVRLTSMLGDEDQPRTSPDGRRIVFTASDRDEVDLWSVRFDGEDATRLTDSGREPTSVSFGPKGKEVFYLDGDGRIHRTSLEGKDGDPIPFTARYEVDLRAERAVVFDEAWRALNELFYDPQFHGVDWQAQRATYRPWALEASHSTDFADVMNLMLGELNASHMGYYPRGADDPAAETTGWLGVVLDPAVGGPGVLVSEVLPDSPAARTDVGLVTGDRILAVGGQEVTNQTNIFGLFTDTVGHRVPLTIRTATGKDRRAIVEPVTSRTVRRLRYEEWIRQRRAIVDSLSAGRLGYIHIQGMDIPSFEEFERGLYAAAHGRDGLVIDVRSNGGGWTTDYLMTVLMVQRHAYTVPRDADPERRAYPTAERLPLGTAWTRPAVALCNEDSYSNAEIFSHAFKTLDRGPLVGSPTFGAVISTSGTTLLDGNWLRLPMRGWYVAGSGVNMELNGAQPDVIIWQPPTEDGSADTDTQLERAVAVLLDDLKTDPRTGSW
jgi:tricorn protease